MARPAGHKVRHIATRARTHAAAHHAAEIDSGNPPPPAAAPPSPPKVPSTTTKGKSGYVYYRYGNPNAPAAPPTPVPGLALEGGGTDIDLLYQWMGARADGVDATVSDNTLVLPGNPAPEAADFLVLGTLKDDAYDPYIYGLNQTRTPLNSVSTLDVPSTTAADDPFVANTIDSASAIFIMGGNQATYVNDWQNTPVQKALDRAAARGVPIGGTSAGLAVLGQFVYSAENTKGAISSDVLANPYSSEISLDQGFLKVTSPAPPAPQQVPPQAALPYLENTITDSHFFERDRMGRLVTFLARLVEDPRWTSPSPPGGPTPLQGTMGIGIDQSTALLIDTAGPTPGAATVIGNSPTNHLYFLVTSGIAPTPGTSNALAAPLSWGSLSGPAVRVHRATVGDNLSLESPLSIDYTLWVANGTLTSSNGSIY
jgi:cyanophycinase-like exopeptidase